MRTPQADRVKFLQGAGDIDEGIIIRNTVTGIKQRLPCLTSRRRVTTRAARGPIDINTKHARKQALIDAL